MCGYFFPLQTVIMTCAHGLVCLPGELCVRQAGRQMDDGAENGTPSTRTETHLPCRRPALARVDCVASPVVYYLYGCGVDNDDIAEHRYARPYR